MRVGIIAEGRGDLAVLTNLLKGALDLDRADITFLRPELSFDETDLHTMAPEQFGTWLFVKQECSDPVKIADFLQVVDEPRLVVIHLDTVEAYRPEFGITIPEKIDSSTYTEALRSRVIDLVQHWLGGRHLEQVRYAIAIEETDAWVLTLYQDGDGDTCHWRTPKEKLFALLPKKRRDMKRISQLKTFDRYLELSRDLRKAKALRQAMKRSLSLRLFCDSLPSDRGERTDDSGGEGE